MKLDGDSGAITETLTGYQVAWPMARGYEGQFGHKLNAPWVWIPLAALFFLGLLDRRRPWRIVHLDLLVLLSFGISQIYFNRGEIGVSVPLAYPPLVYLLARMLWIGFRGGDGLRPSVAASKLAIVAIFLIVFRVTLNIADSGVIDVGYAGHRRRRPDHPRPADLRRGRVPRGQPLRRHLRPRQLLRLRPVRARAAVERVVGRASLLARRGDRLRPARRRRPVRVRDADAPGTRRARPRRGPRVRLGRVPVHGVRAAVELERRPRRRAGDLGAGAVRPAARPRGAAGDRRRDEVRAARPRAAVRRRRARPARRARAGRRLAARVAAARRDLHRRVRARHRGAPRPSGDRPRASGSSSSGPSRASSTARLRSASGARSTGSSGCRTASSGSRRCSRRSSRSSRGGARSPRSRRSPPR